MKKTLTSIAILLVAVLIMIPLSGCSTKPKETTLNIAYQYGMSFAPMLIIKEQNLIEKHYGSAVTVNWHILNSGSAINEGFIADEIDVAGMGIAPFVTGVSKGIPYKLLSALCQQPMGLNTTNPNLKLLSDFTPEDKIALVSLGSMQHITLGMAAEKELGDAHAMDYLILGMNNPDGMQALLSGAVAAHLPIAPYYNIELEMDDIYEIESVRKSIEDFYPNGYTVVNCMASTKLFEENRKLYDAVASAMREAIDYVNSNTRETAQILCDAEGLSLEQMERFLQDEKCLYTSIPSGILETAAFMERADFAENVPTTLEEIYFEDLLKHVQERGNG